MVQDIAGSFAAQVEIGMVGKTYGGRLIGGGVVFDAQGVVGSEPVVDRDRKIAGVTRFTIGALQPQFESLVYVVANGFDLPHFLVKTLGSAVEVTIDAVGLAIEGQGVVFSSERELTLGNAVPITTDEGAVKRGVGLIGGKVIIAQDNICQGAVGVRHQQAGDATAIAADFDLHAGVIRQGEVFNRFTEFCLSKIWHSQGLEFATIDTIKRSRVV